MYSEPLICEDVEAWKYGPVIPSICHTLKKFKRGTIAPKKYPIASIEFKDKSNNERLFGENEIEIMNIVLEVYNSLSISKLIAITHKKNSPCHKH